MIYALVVDGQLSKYPYGFSDLRADNPQVSFPSEVSDEWLAERGIVTVAPVERPAPGATTHVVEGSPQLINGVWTQSWTEVEASADEIAARQRASADRSARSAIKADAFVGNFIAMTPAEVTAYIEANVTNLASAKSVINKLALMVLLLARREFRD